MRDLLALHRFLAERGPMPFEWGDHSNDCVSCAAAAVVVQGGKDLVKRMRWSNEEEAYAALDKAGGLEVAVSKRLTPITPAFAKRGDIGAIEAGNGLILVIVEGEALVGPGPERMRRLPRKLMVRAWSAL